MMRILGRFTLLFFLGGGITGFLLNIEHIDFVVPLMFALIALVALGFLVLSEPKI